MSPKILLYFVFTLLPILSFGQNVQIKAIVVDEKSNEPILGASAALLKQSSQAYVKGQQSDIKGQLLFQDVDAGVYTLRISYMGYTNLIQENIVVQANKNVDLGTLSMLEDGKMLGEVLVEGKVPAMEIGIDRKVFNVGQSLVSVGGTATDLLANVPTLQVDMDGTVSLRGSSSVRILIDGKESAMAGSDITSLLQSLPANAIEKVEVITNPSSKYDAEGQSGIINIVLKKNVRTGLNGTINASAGSYNNYMAGASLNYKDEKFNYSGSYNFNRRNMVGGGLTNNTYLNNNSQINNTEDSERKGINNMVKLGVEYSPNAKTTIGISGNLSIRDNDRRNDLNYNYFNHPELSGTSFRGSRQKEDDLGYDLNLDFSRKFAREGEELTANFMYGRDTEDGTNDFNQTYSSGLPATSRLNKTSEDGKNMNIQVDYTLPFSKDSKLETGYKSIIRKSADTQFSDTLDNVSGNYFPDYDISNDFDLTNSVHALYVNYQNKLTDKISYQIGLRGEQTYLTSTYFKKDPSLPANEIETVAKQNYFRLYPTAFLTYALGEKGDKIQFSYSRRVQRPRGWQVNPFEDVSDDMNRRQGNPNLLPEDIHSFEMSYAKFYDKWNILATGYYRRMKDVMQPYIYEVDTLSSVTRSRWENLTNSSVAGLELISKVNATSWLDFTVNGNMFYNRIDGNADFGIKESDGINWNANLTSNVKILPSLSGQLRADYNAPRLLAQGKTKAMTGIDVGLKQEVLNKKGSIMFNVRDLLNTRKFGGYINTAQVNSSFERRWMKRMFMLSFSYRFGAQDFGKKKRPENSIDMEGGEQF
ncbi:TonB-dependent receptor domain-containing protein [Sphingobacterium spiritivorum]|uniref:TonB-dependent receptor domain-containing protein n=1 Tax=Sphingobacterium spiritivorum TaxID=258 RepID=UPI003DA3108D